MRFLKWILSHSKWVLNSHGVTLISGTRGTSDIEVARRKLDVPDEIFLLQPDAAPLVQILSQAKKKQAINPEITWFEDELLPQSDTTEDLVTTVTQTSIKMTNTGYFFEGDIIRVEASDELLRCTTTSGQSITVERGWAGSTAAIITASITLLKLGNANEEGSGAPVLRSTTVSKVYNYLQIFKTPFGVTETENASELYGGGDLNYLRIKKLIEHKVQMERALLFGERYEDTTGTHPKRTTQGVQRWIATNITAVSTTLTESAFETFLETGFTYGSTRKVLIASPKVVSAINYWARGKLNMYPKDKTYGISVMQYLSAHGEVQIIRHKLLTGTTFGGYAFLLDMNNLFFRFLKGRDTKLERNIQDNDEDQEKDQYITEMGLELRSQKTHSIMTGVSAYS